MALTQSAAVELAEVLRHADSGDMMRMILQSGLQAPVDAEAEAFIGAARHERGEDRVAVRNGTRTKTVATTSGDLAVKIPKLRSGSFFPTLLEPRRRVDVALHAVIMEAYVHGTSTRKVDDLVAAMGVASGVSKSEVSRICADLDEQVAEFLGRELDHVGFPYVFLDATYCKVRVGGGKAGKGGKVVSQAVVIATGVAADGNREVLGCAVGDSETFEFWADFLRSLRERGLSGVALVISDHHAGLRKAVAQIMIGTAWQRCRVHFLRNILARVGKSSAEMVGATIRTIFAQPTADTVRDQVDTVAATLEARFPDIATMLRDAKPDITAFADFPEPHWRKIWSTNPIERVNLEVKRRTDVVGIFPNPAALLRLAACVLMEQHDEWQAAERRYLSEGSMAALNPPIAETIEPRHAAENTDQSLQLTA